MNNLDDVFKKKLAPGVESPADFEARHPFQEEYWLAAEKLIEKQKKRRRNALFMVICGIGIAAGFWFSESSQTTGDASSTDFAGNAYPTTQESPPSNQPTTDYSSHTIVHNIRSNAEGAANVAAPSNFSSTLASKSLQKMSGTPHFSTNLNQKSFQIAATSLQLSNPSEVSAIVSNATFSEQNRATAIEKLPTKNIEKVYFFDEPSLTTSIFDSKMKKKHEKMWQIGAVLGGMWFPNNGSTSTALGGWVTKKVHPNLKVFAETQIRLRNDVGPALRSEQTRYDFGYTTQQHFLQRKQSFWLEIPLGIQFSNNQWAGETGIVQGFLLGQLGEFRTQTLRSFEPTSVVTDVKKVWMDDSENYRKYYLALFAGARWEFSRRFAIGLRTQLLLHNLEKNSEITGVRTPQVGFETQLKFKLQ